MFPEARALLLYVLGHFLLWNSFLEIRNFYYLVFLSARDERVFYNTKK